MRVPTLVAVLLACAAPLAALATDVQKICASSPPPGPCVVATAVAVSPGSTLDFGARGLVLTGAGELDAGGGTMTINAASLVLQPGARLTSAGPLGQINVTTTGNIDVQAATNRAKVDVSGTSGGYITFVAGGDLAIAGQLTAAATVVQGDGGSIDVTGATATLAASGKISAMGGSNGYGGEVSITASTGSTIIAGTIDASAGSDGGYIAVEANTDLTMYPGSLLNVKAGPGADADSIDLTADTGAVTLAGVIDASAAGSLDLGGGTGGDVTVEAATTLGSVATINTSGGGTDGLAGDVDFESDGDGDILVRGPIDASAPGTSGYGGAVSFYTTAGTVDLGGNVYANAGGVGGDIDASSFGTVRVTAGKLVADGPNASIDLEGCAVSVSNVASLSSQGSNGVNLVQASGQMTIAGPLLAGNANRLEYLDPGKPPIVSFAPVPAPTVVENPGLTPCGGPTTTVTTSTSSTTTTTVFGPSTTTTVALGTTTTLGAATTTTTASTSTSSTTTSTATTVASTTVTTTTATTRPPTTATVATTTSTPPTTLAEASCVPVNCDDGDDCTDDVCDAVAGCQHAPRPGLDLVSCRLDLLATALVVSPAAELGGATARARYSAKIGKARRMVDAARGMPARRKLAMLRRAEHVLGAFSQAIRKAATHTHHKVQADVAARLLQLAAGAAASLATLTQ